MIVFSSIGYVPFMNYNSVFHKWDNIYNVNVNSYDMSMPIIMGLFPWIGDISDGALLNDESAQFEIEFYNYMVYGKGFVPMMSIVSQEHNDGCNLYLYHVTDSPTTQSMIESLSHLLSQRYGIRILYFNTIEDLYPGFLDGIDSSFSIDGLISYDADYLRYIEMKGNLYGEQLVEE